MPPEPDFRIAAETESAGPPTETSYRWYHKLGALLFVILTFELGVFLVVFPWLAWWELSYFSGLSPWWEPVWDSPYFRGAVSGVGLVDIYISFLDLFRMRRFYMPD